MDLNGLVIRTSVSGACTVSECTVYDPEVKASNYSWIDFRCAVLLSKSELNIYTISMI